MKTSPNSHKGTNSGPSTANDEWSKMINSATRICECQTIMTKLGSNKPKKEIDLRQVTADDLKSIQKQDPFMYYSIPGVRSATVLMRDIDTSSLGASAMSRTCVSHSSMLQTQDKASPSQKVTRSTCISFECNPDLLFEDFLNDDEDLGIEGAESSWTS